MKKVIEIQILGQHVRIRHEDEDYIRELENFIHRKIDDIQKNQKASSTLNLAARVIITLADEYFSLSKEKEDVAKEIERKAKRLIDLIEANSVLSE